MIQLLLALVVVAILYFTVLGGADKTVDEAVDETAEALYQQTGGLYQRQIEKTKGLEQSMQQAADQKMQRIDRQINGD
ncbi:MAG: hypothetical protein IZT60_05450 [Gammaproteobacteria bacterium]|nr:hypothetical protein [Gammaproteobacteria bacterium]